ncbi:MAG: sugar transferase [Flavobacteriales bacterium]|jgi:exopolysaccharide biosynthesis polyprenyl glycosylphosphotransferase|nr:sugar transferase [Flavobacteriales bacterium]
MINRRILSIKYMISDLTSAILSWICFYYFRKTVIESSEFVMDNNFYLGLALIPLFWILFYAATGNYKNVYKKHRIKEIGQTILTSIIGNLLLFFLLILDDEINTYQDYYNLLGFLILVHTSLTLTPRFFLTSSTVKRIHRREIGFNTLIIGGNEKALKIYREIEAIKNSPGYLFKGFLSTNGIDRSLSDASIEHYGNYKLLKQTITNQEIEEVIIAVESSEHENINKIINDLSDLNVRIKIIPDMYNILMGSVKMTAIFGALLIEVNPEIMPPWQKTTKRFMDIFISIIALIILLPVFIILAIMVWYSSKGPILYKQERVGRLRKEFFIYKFRSMVQNAEKDGPQLSSSTDPRITNIGRIMRKTRLDEIPQFINVLKGEMSIVGPRPERQYFIDKIKARAPHYKHLEKVKPGITSWGQVKYGYAENVDEMISRLKYDVLYVENMSISLDIKIMFYTLIIISKGSGK